MAEFIDETEAKAEKARLDGVIHDYYDRHPEKAAKIGKSLVDEVNREYQEKAALYDMAARSSAINNSLGHSYRDQFLWLANLSWLQWIVVNALLVGLLFWLKLPDYVFYVVSIAFSLYLIRKRIPL